MKHSDLILGTIKEKLPLSAPFKYILVCVYLRVQVNCEVKLKNIRNIHHVIFKVTTVIYSQVQDFKSYCKLLSHKCEI